MLLRTFIPYIMFKDFRVRQMNNVDCVLNRYFPRSDVEPLCMKGKVVCRERSYYFSGLKMILSKVFFYTAVITAFF